MVKFDNSKDKSYHDRIKDGEKRMFDMIERMHREDEREKERQERSKKKTIEEKERMKNFEMEVSFSSSGTSATDNDSDFEPSPKKQKISKDRVCLQLSMNDILDKWVPFLTRYKVSVRAETSLLASLFSIAGVDLNTVPVSKSGLHRNRKIVIENEAEMVREENPDKVRDLKVVLHFDTKLVKHYRTEKKMSETVERLALSLSSPQVNEPLDFLLGVLEIESSKGQDQAIAIQNILEYYELTDQIIGCSADTTASNTGKYNGAIKFLVDHVLQRPVLWLLCRY